MESSKFKTILKRIFFDLIISCLSLIVGFILILVGTKEMRLSKDIENWPETEGIVIDSKVNYRYYGNNDSPLIEYSAKILYTYSIDGKIYKSDRRTFKPETGDKEYADSTRALYPKNSKIQVSYHPEKPSVSVLDPRERPIFHTGTLVGIIFLLFGIGFFFVKFMKEAEKQKGVNP